MYGIMVFVKLTKKGVLGLYANVAQLFRALPCQGRGRELESLHSHHFCYVPEKIIQLANSRSCESRVRVSSFAPFLLQRAGVVE